MVESNAKSNIESNAQSPDTEQQREESDKSEFFIVGFPSSHESCLLNVDMDEVQKEILKCSTFAELEHYFNSLESVHFLNMEKPVLKAKCNAKVDRVTLIALPKDAPKGVVPIETVGDSNCFPCAISKALFDNESHHKEIRLLLVIEGVRNRVHYLDNNYLSMGASHIHRKCTFKQQYALFSGQHYPNTGNVDDIVETIYETEMMQLRLDGSFMGMWQQWAACNVIGRPIRSVFPDRGINSFRSDFNRLCVPLYRICQNHLPLNIMWTPIQVNGDIHFVPLLHKC